MPHGDVSAFADAVRRCIVAPDEARRSAIRHTGSFAASVPSNRRGGRTAERAAVADRCDGERMTSLTSGAPFLGNEVDARHAAEPRAPLWLRDDDAVEPTPPYAARRSHRAPWHSPGTGSCSGDCRKGTGAKGELQNMSLRWSTAGRIANHAPEGEKKQEFGPHRPVEAMRRELSALSRMREIFAEQMTPIFVPPWNRIAAELVPALAKSAMPPSTFGVAQDDKPAIPKSPHISTSSIFGVRAAAEHGVLAKRSPWRWRILSITAAIRLEYCRTISCMTNWRSISWKRCSHLPRGSHGCPPRL